MLILFHCLSFDAARFVNYATEEFYNCTFIKRTLITSASSVNNFPFPDGIENRESRDLLRLANFDGQPRTDIEQAK